MKKFAFLMLMIITIFGTSSAGATMLDLSSGGSGFINGAFFTTADVSSTGTGVIDPFLRLQKNRAEEGYNTSGTKMPDVKNDQWTKDLRFNSIPIVKLGGVNYLEFLLDINQTKANPLLSLDKLVIYTSDTAGQSAPGNSTPLDNLGTKVYDMGNNYIKMDYSLNAGSGSGDLFAYIPVSFFGNDDYVILYSKFGTNFPTNDGFEEWAVRKVEQTPVPEPATFLLFGIGLIGVASLGKKQ